MVDRPCPVYYKGIPSAFQRWIEHKLLGGPKLLKCDECGQFHIKDHEDA